MNLQWSRRSLLRSLGAGAALVPLLNAGRSARAATAFPRRLVIIVKPNGTIPDYFWPSGSETSFSFGRILASLEPFKQDLVVLRGLSDLPADDDGISGGHQSFISIMTGATARAGNQGLESKFGSLIPVRGPSIDQAIAVELLKQNPQIPRRSLELATMLWHSQADHQTRISYRGPDVANTPEEDPWKLASALFAGKTTTTGPDPAYAQLLKKRKSVLDYVGREIDRFSVRLGTDDKLRIGAHLDSIRQIERELAPNTTATTGCATPDLGPAVDANASGNEPSTATYDNPRLHGYPAVVKAQMDLLVSALACDVTRVVTLQLSHAAASNLVFSWLGEDFVHKGDEYPVRNYHDMTHQAFKNYDAKVGIQPGSNMERKVKAETWFAEQFAYFLTRMKAQKEGDGSMLDNTAVVYLDGMSEGASHDWHNLPIILAGGCGGAFKTGRYLQFRNAPHNGLWIAIANAMGVPMTTFGDAKYGGELAGLRTR